MAEQIAESVTVSLSVVGGKMWFFCENTRTRKTTLHTVQDQEIAMVEASCLHHAHDSRYTRGSTTQNYIQSNNTLPRQNTHPRTRENWGGGRDGGTAVGASVGSGRRRRGRGGWESMEAGGRCRAQACRRLVVCLERDLRQQHNIT